VYEYLEGTLAARTAGRVVIDVGGVGYDVLVPIGTALPEAGQRLRVWTHFVVREDAHVLCGFPERSTRELFRLLLNVHGVGPVMAMAILSGMSRDELLRAIAAGDAAALERIKGVGSKTASQILIDAGEKARKLLAGGSVADGVVTPPGRDTLVDDAIAALVSIGYSEKEAKKSVEKVAAKTRPKDLETLLRSVLAG